MTRLSGWSRQDLLGKPNPVRFFASEHESDELDFRECLQGSPSGSAASHLYLRTYGGQLRPFYVQSTRIAEGGWSFLVSEISRSALCRILDGDLAGSASFQTLVGRDQRMLDLYDRIRKAAAVDVTILVAGESGTGKELIARAVHNTSSRREAPFVAVHCAALPEALLESELFGHARGAFTGAVKDNPGRFETARGGTLFLDEIGEISPAVQVKFLRVLQERRYTRVGESVERTADLRIITATNRNLKEMVHNGSFREDLFYRLNVFPLQAPPLRLRRNDIPLLANHVIGKLNERHGRRIAGLSTGALRLLMDYPFPGNVRELENALEHAFVLSSGTVLEAEDLPPEIRNIGNRTHFPPEGADPRLGQVASAGGYQPVRPGFRPRNILTDAEIDRVLAEVNNNRSEAARRLGISRVSLWKRLKKRGETEKTG